MSELYGLAAMAAGFVVGWNAAFYLVWKREQRREHEREFARQFMDLVDKLPNKLWDPPDA